MQFFLIAKFVALSSCDYDFKCVSIQYAGGSLFNICLL